MRSITSSRRRRRKNNLLLVKHLKKIDEKGIDLAKVSTRDTYLADYKPKANNASLKKKLRNLEDKLEGLFTNVKWNEIKYTTGGTYFYPILPTNIATVFKQAQAIHTKIFKSSDEFTRKWGEWKGLTQYPDIKFNVEVSNRTHFPSGIADYNKLTGKSLGYKLYRALAKHLGYITSGDDASEEAQRVWAKLVSKHMHNRKPTPEDLHVITNSSYVMVMEKGLPLKEKVKIAMKYLDNIGFEPDEKVIIDDELKDILKKEHPEMFDPEAKNKKFEELGLKKARTIKVGKTYIPKEELDELPKIPKTKKDLIPATMKCVFEFPMHNSFLMVGIKDLQEYAYLLKRNATLRLDMKRPEASRAAYTLRRLGVKALSLYKDEAKTAFEIDGVLKESRIVKYDEFDNI